MAFTNVLGHPPLSSDSLFALRRGAARLWSKITSAAHSLAAPDVLPINSCPIEQLAPFRGRAAVPAVRVEREATGTTLYWDLPAANRSNTEVVWDPARRSLAVGVWSSSVKRVGGQGPRRGTLLWYGSVCRPGEDGERATARLESGCVGVHLPRCRTALTPEPPAPATAPASRTS